MDLEEGGGGGYGRRGAGDRPSRSSKKSGRKGGRKNGRKTKSSSREDRPSMLDLRTIYEGPAGPRTNKMLWKTTLVITNRCVEIEREGANALLSCLTLGCWYFMFQTATIEIYEYSRIAGLHMTSDDAIIIEMEPTTTALGFKNYPRVVITLPPNAHKKPQDLFNEMKGAWNMAHGIKLNYGETDLAMAESDSDEDGLLGVQVQ